MLKNSSPPSGHLRFCTFQEVLPLWQEKLWPGRKSPIESKSSIKFGGGYDRSIYEREPSLFWGYFHAGKLIGVNSGFWTGDREFRSRGLYVHPHFRNRGVAQSLLTDLLAHAARQGAQKVWSLPRKTALKTYEAVGFKTYGDFFSQGMEFGPNIFVHKDI